MANAIRSNGVSASWQKGQRDAVRIFNDFLKQDEEESEGTALTRENLGSFAAVRFMKLRFSSSTPTRFPRTGTRGASSRRRRR